MKVVIDTNVFVGACLGKGASNQVVELCLQRDLVPVVGNALFSEYEDVLQRPNLFTSCRLSTVEREELFDAFVATSEWVKVYFNWRPNLRDEADNHLVELAVAASARCIVTYNLKDLKDGELSFPAIKVMTPEKLVKELKL